MGFASDWLEAAFGRWTQRSGAARGATRRLLCVHGFGAFVRALAHAPDPVAAKCAALALGTLIVHIFILLRPQHIRWAQICTCSRDFLHVFLLASIFSPAIARGSGTIFLLVVDCLTSRPGHDALFPAILATFAIYTLLTLPFYVVLGGTIILSVIQTCTFVLFVQPLKTNEVRSAFSPCMFLVFRSFSLCYRF
ncbi:hypothetical protein ANCCAN_12360 [Ancylostoma caninum]|uniref:Uncharacterized protein n=1 Tax=Ancylostoma caninum TaxID=29170 RepID=A0A368GF65_ANCCA|nr:hypothetical protein ANCCAN_12360 [Ancylostoma caninum]